MSRLAYELVKKMLIIYTVDKESGFIKQAVDAFKVGMNNEGISKNNKITYTVVLGETGKKYIVIKATN